MNDDEELGPVDPGLGSLFAAERAARAPAGAKARGWEKLAAAIAPPPLAPPSPAAAPAAAMKLLAALAIGGVIGGTIVAVARPPQVVYVDRPVPAPSVAPAPAPPPSVVVVPPVVRAPEPQPSATATVFAAPSASASGSLAAERALLDDGRATLKSDPHHSLDVAVRHAREFPRGQLGEEREVIAIEALTNLARCREATERGNAFKQRYPNSVLGPVVDTSISTCGH